MNKERIYICSSMNNLYQCRALARVIELLGHEVVSFWHEQEPVVPHNDEHARALADYYQIEKCTLLIGIDIDSSSAGGSHAEVGFAAAHEKRIVLIGGTVNSLANAVAEVIPLNPHMARTRKILAESDEIHDLTREDKALAAAVKRGKR